MYNLKHLELLNYIIEEYVKFDPIGVVGAITIPRTEYDQESLKIFLFLAEYKPNFEKFSKWAENFVSLGINANKREQRNFIDNVFNKYIELGFDSI